MRLMKLVKKIKNSPTSLITNGYMWQEINDKKFF